MASQAITDYLTKRISIDKEIVTYRLLSRQFGIHVNVAKKELAEYHANAAFHSQVSSAIYLLNGRIATPPRQERDEFLEDYDMEGVGSSRVDEDGYDDEEGDVVPQFQSTLVNEKDLDHAKAKYEVLHEVYVYCLAPSPFRDAGFICDSTKIVRETDVNKGADFSLLVGKIRTPGIKVVAPPANKKAVAGPSKSKGPQLKKAPSVAAQPKVKEEVPATEKGKEKAKPTKNNFFSSKPKEPPTKEAPKPEPVVKESPKAAPVVKELSKASLAEKRSSKAAPVEKDAVKAEASKASEKTLKEPPKRGLKRKSVSALLSDSEGDSKDLAPPSKPPSKSEEMLKTRRGVVISEDEEDSDAPRIPRRITKSKPKTKSLHEATTTEDERDLDALMDVDEDDVIRVSKPSAFPPPPSDVDDSEPQADVDVDGDQDMNSEDDAPKEPKPRKKKGKKVWPVGKNGIKKRRVVKSKHVMDDKGYRVAVDYSEYESVDEEEQEPEAPAKATAKGKRKSVAADKEPEQNDSEASTKTKPAGKTKGKKLTKGGQQNLGFFFTKK